MTANDKITLFDLISKDGNRSWSLNPWKVRLYLNFKKIPYETQWMEYPDIAPAFKKFGIPPNEAPAVPYTIPAILHPPSSYVMESRNIVEFLESKYAEPILDVDSPNVEEAQALVLKASASVRSSWVAQVPRNLLPPRSAEYFYRTRSIRFEKDLNELEKSIPVDQTWEEGAPAFKELAALFKRNTEGPFINGKTVTYADFVVVGMLQFLNRIDSKLLDRAFAIDSVLKDVYDACGEWLARDDY